MLRIVVQFLGWKFSRSVAFAAAEPMERAKDEFNRERGYTDRETEDRKQERPDLQPVVFARRY